MNWSKWLNDKRLFEAPEAAGSAPATPVDPVPEQAQEAAPDLSFIPSEYRSGDAPDFAKFGEHYQSLVAEQAKWQEAQPEVPESYELAIPEDISFDGMELPEGFEIDLDLENEAYKPIVGELGDFLKAVKAPADAAPQIMGLLAKYEAARNADFHKQQKAINESVAADLAKLGTPDQVKARMETLSRRIDAALPAEQAAAIKKFTGSTDALKALETLLGPRGMPTGDPAPPQAAAYDPLSARYPKSMK